MGAYPRGTPINLVERFFTVDPLTEAATPADPTTVTFTIERPDDSTVSYVYGTDANVTRAAVGVYVCALLPPLPTGTYRYVCVGTGAAAASSSDTFDVLPDGVLPPATAPVPSPGPCVPWISGDDVAEANPNLGIGSDTWLLEEAAVAASEILFEVSGRQFNGGCERTWRPCADTCGCWDTYALGLRWYWTTGPISYAYAFAGGGFAPGGYGLFGWRSECGDVCGCGYESEVLLPGYPVRDVLEVKIDGAVLSPTSYRLDGNRRLVRLYDPPAAPGGEPIPARWPLCQNIAVDDDQPGTFSIRYRWGIEPPRLGVMAAAQLAGELYKFQTTGKCALPSRVTKVVRQGLTIDREVAAFRSYLRQGTTGLPLLDSFLAAVNPNAISRRPGVWTPDVRTGRRVA